jgi:hypothetical protein
MAHTYHQKNGEWFTPKARNPIGEGYSGTGVGRNAPALEWMHDVGPIPAGEWLIGPMNSDHPHLGPDVMALTPVGHDAHGRTDFFIHGNNSTNDASHGCIIQLHGVRMAINSSDDKKLLVVP